jgi:hypothetical protein
MHAATKWDHADDVELDDNKLYLVMTNAWEWGDSYDPKVLQGRWVRHLLRPEMVRGRPTWLAEITMPQVGAPK